MANLAKYLCTIFILGTICVSPSWSQSQGGKSTTSSGDGIFIFNPGFFYRHDQRKQSDVSTVEIIYFDLNLGYQFPSNWYLGVLYSYEQERVVSDNFPVDGIDTRSEYTRTNYGLSGGYVHGSYYARLHYLFGANWQVDENNTSVSYENGWGLQCDFGINFELFDTFLLGPKLTYKHIVYRNKKGSEGSSDLNPDLVKTSIDPYFVVWWEF